MYIPTGGATDELATSQFGLLTRAQLIACGWSRHAVDRALRDGCLEALHLGVYRVAGSPPSPQQRCLAAVLRAGDGARLTGSAALSLLHVRGIAGLPQPEVIVPGDRRLTGIDFRCARDSSPARHRTTIDGIPATNPARSFVEAVVRWRRRRALSIHDQLRWQELVQPGEVASVASALPTRHRGARVVRSLADEGELDQDSGGERSLADALDDLGLLLAARWQVWVTPRIRVDCLLDVGLSRRVLELGEVAEPRRGVVLEYDGERHHRHHRDIRADARRQGELERLGHRVMRVQRQHVRDVASLRQLLLAALDAP